MSDEKQVNTTNKEKDAVNSKEEVARLVKMAKGERSINAYARAAGVSTAAISKILNLEYMPSPDTMRKLTSEAAEPRGGVTFDEMRRAAGWASEEENHEDRDILLREESDESEFDKENKAHGDPYNTLNAEEKNRRIREIIQEHRAYEKECISQVYIALVDRGILFRKADMASVARASSASDLEIDILEQSIKEWSFRFLHWQPGTERKVGPLRFFERIGYLLINETADNIKFSYVINSDQVFQYIKRYDHKLPFRGELSVILYDPIEKELVEECYLSNYYEEDRSRELYIVER